VFRTILRMLCVRSRRRKVLSPRDSSASILREQVFCRVHDLLRTIGEQRIRNIARKCLAINSSASSRIIAEGVEEVARLPPHRYSVFDMRSISNTRDESFE